tara:strand:- start:2230 stop:2682 length:453 start_codon:yes stop_codon:yes gene_type:complete
MKINDILTEQGVIVKGVNTTVDVQPGETERQAAKLFPMNKGGKPASLVSDKVRKNSNPHVLFNLGLTEEQMILLEKVVQQSKPMKVLMNLASRKDNNPFPVKMGDVVIEVKPATARRIIHHYFGANKFKQREIERDLESAMGFKKLVKEI